MLPFPQFDFEAIDQYLRYKYKMTTFGRPYSRPQRSEYRSEVKKKDNNPTSFDQIYTNPLKELIYLAAYTCELKVEAEKTEHEQELTANRNTYRRGGGGRYEQDLMRRRQYERYERMNRHRFQGYDRYGGPQFGSRRRRTRGFEDYYDYDYEDDEFGEFGRHDRYDRDFEERPESELDWAIKKQNKRTIFDVMRETKDNFRNIKDIFVKNKERVARCLAEMNSTGRGGGYLASSDQWDSIQTKIDSKMRAHEAEYRRKLQCLANIAKPSELCLSLTVSSKTADKSIKKMSDLVANDFLVLLNLAIYYLIAPERDHFVRDITAFQKSVDEVMKKYSNEDNDLTSLIENLPYKESSFYWEKIINCVRKIANLDHYNDIHNRKIEFETEFAGTITSETLQRLCNKGWLDNTITSAVIEYLKLIEGFNNYHDDNTFKAKIYNHSESYAFMNSTNLLDEDIPKYQKLVFLINIDNSHWITIAVYLRDSVMAAYDSLNYETEKYCNQIAARLKKLGKKFRQPDYNLTPRQSNLSDCGVFAIINLIMAVDKQQREEAGDMYDYRNSFKPAIISEIRHSLFLLLCYLGYCKKNIMVPRKDYFDIMFRSTIYENIGSKLHKRKNKQ